MSAATLLVRHRLPPRLAARGPAEETIIYRRRTMLLSIAIFLMGLGLYIPGLPHFCKDSQYHMCIRKKEDRFPFALAPSSGTSPNGILRRSFPERWGFRGLLCSGSPNNWEEQFSLPALNLGIM
ncbi:hypothetical protein BBP40_003322 [Aspergillus hancockii]|nr:hypothetical protein BBP40_003322 [Aspergillus hancockii]